MTSFPAPCRAGIAPRAVAALFVLGLSFSAAAAGPAIDVSRLDEPANSDDLMQEVALLNKQIHAKPAQAALYARRGAAWFKLRDFDKSVEDFSEALKFNDKMDEAYFGRGMALGRNGQIDEGLIDLGVYLHRNPRSSLAYTKRGVRHLWKGDLDSAEKDFVKAIALNPKNAEAHDDLGVVYAQRGQFDKAEHHFLATVRAEPSYQKGFHNLAMVYHITQRHDRALEAVNRALALIADARDSMLLKSEILAALGRHTEAKALRADAEFLPASERSSTMAIQ